MTPDRVVQLSLLMLGVLALLGISGTLLFQDSRRRTLEARVAYAATGGGAPRPAMSGAAAYLFGLGERVRRGGRLYSEADLEHLQGLLAAAGYNPRRVLPILLGAKLAMMIVLPPAAFLLSAVAVDGMLARLGVAAAALVLGMLGPDWILGSMRRSYLAALDRGTPDALDLLVVCSEAGMGLESALERVAQEMPRSNNAMALALNGLLDDLRVLPDRREAFQNFGRRTGSEGLQRLASMLSQALQFGTPLGQALRAVAGELRRERMNRLEERAVKLPVKLIMPLMLFILPTLWIVMAGTSFLRLFDVIGVMSAHMPPHVPFHK